MHNSGLGLVKLTLPKPVLQDSEEMQHHKQLNTLATFLITNEEESSETPPHL